MVFSGFFWLLGAFGVWGLLTKKLSLCLLET